MAAIGDAWQRANNHIAQNNATQRGTQHIDQGYNPVRYKGSPPAGNRP